MAALVALFVAGGFAERALALCDHPAGDASCAHGCDSHEHEQPTGSADDECRCDCHHGFVVQSIAAPSLRFVGALTVTLREGAAFPPDAMPPAIEHPPQLA